MPHDQPGYRDPKGMAVRDGVLYRRPLNESISPAGHGGRTDLVRGRMHVGRRKSRMPKPVHITVQVVDENDQPLANTVVRVQQSAPAGDRFFCLNIALYGGRGCGTFKEWSLFEGDYPASGSLDITIEYFGGLNVQVVEPCDNTAPKAMRRYSLLSLATTGLIDGQQFKVKPVDSHLTGHSVEYGPCTTRLPSVESFDKQF